MMIVFLTLNGLQSRLLPGEIRPRARRAARGRTPPVPGPGLARTAAGRRGQHLAGLYRIRRFRRLYAADARRPHGALLAFSRQPARCTPAHGRRTKRRQRGEKQMAPHLVPRGCRRGRHGRRGRLRRHGAFGQERHRLLPAPRQA